ncbi:MAG: PAS domain S-box protein [Opitutaceae bacterium]|nr:PAS domain S-box protein [Opitutaceae bacterium]
MRPQLLPLALTVSLGVAAAATTGALLPQVGRLTLAGTAAAAAGGAGLVLSKRLNRVARRETAAKEELRFSRFAMDHARDSMVVLDGEGTLLYANEETCRLTGYSRDELVGARIFKILTDPGAAQFSRLWEIIEQRGTHVFEFAIRTKEGAERPIEVAATFLEFHGSRVVFAVSRDIAARKAAESAYREVEGRARMTQYALDHAQDLVSVIDSEGRRLYVNEAFCRFTGRDFSELQSSRVWDNLPAHGEQGYRRLWQVVKERGSLSLEVELLHKSGALRPIEVNCSFLVIDGTEAVCTVSRDLTSRKAAEHERQLIEQQLRETQKLESLGVLAGGIAHDFNNLLTGILGNASLARDRLPEADPLHNPLLQVEKAAVRAAELCQQMLAYAGKGRVVVGPVDLSSLVEETANLLQVSIARRARLELRLMENLPLVQADATQMRQIVMNLVLNAAEAIDKPDGLITVTTGTVDVTREFIHSARVCTGMEPGQGVFLEVKDNGSGMTRETLERIFEPFFTTKFTGRGLGLAAVLGIVRSHHGALDVASEVGGGTRFTLVLAPQPLARDSARVRQQTSRSPFRRYGRILVVDDEESVREVAVQALQRGGFKVDAASSGDQAIELLKSAIADYHLILLDFSMPQRDGVSVLRSIREIKAHTPVVMMSGLAEEEARQRMQGLTVEAFLSKPFTLSQIREKVDAILPTAGPEQANQQTEL